MTVVVTLAYPMTEFRSSRQEYQPDNVTVDNDHGSYVPLAMLIVPIAGDKDIPNRISQLLDNFHGQWSMDPWYRVNSFRQFYGNNKVNKLTKIC